MENSDNTAILEDDETDQRWNQVLAETANTWPTEQVADQSSQGPSPESHSTDAPTSTSQPRQPTPGCAESAFSQINRDLFVSKVFYFFFYAAYGSLYPLLPVYFKQLGMSPSQSGLLVGIRYFIEFCGAPFWGVVADRFKKGKAVLLFSVLCWLVFSCGIVFVKPADMTCVQLNSTTGSQNSTQPNTSSVHSRNRRYLAGDLLALPRLFYGVHSPSSRVKLWHRYERSLTNFTDTNINAMMPDTVTSSATAGLKNSTIVYNKDQVDTIFLTILLIIIIGEFFSAPAVTIVDTVTLKYLGQHRDRYGLQRMWGSLGWGVAMLCVGIWIDHTYFQPFIQGTGCSQPEHKNYLIAFIVFGVLMGLALLVATQFYFGGGTVQGAAEAVNVPWSSLHEVSPGATSTEGVAPSESSPQEFRFSDLQRALCNVRNGTVLFVAWFMGFGYGFVFSFLYWYLQSLNGTTTLFGICSVLNHISELIAYFASHKLIELVGHIRVLYIGLACNTARYLYISYLQNAWIVLPMEVLQGMTHASVWAACISYLSAAVPLSLRTSAQGILQGLHLGLGRGCGAMLGGVFVSYFGEAATFRGIGMASLIILLLFYLSQCLGGQGDSVANKTLVENVPVPSSPISIATIDLERHHDESQRAQLEQQHRQHPVKTKHQEEQEDASRPAWALSGTPWVNMAFALCHIQEVIKKARSNTQADTWSPQGTTEGAQPMGSAETSHECQADQPSPSEQPNSPIRRPSKTSAESTSTHREDVQPSTLPPTDQSQCTENPIPLPGNFEKPSGMSSNNPFYQ